MSAQHSHRHEHPHPPQSKNPHDHHHPFDRRLRRGRPNSVFAHAHAITEKYGRTPPPEIATARVKALWRKVYTWFPHAVSLGVYAYRKIAGSSRWSEHAWADAWDMASPGSVKTGQPDGYLRAMVEYVNREVMTDRPGDRIIFGDAAHKNHAHNDRWPDHTGTPPRQ